MCELIGVCMADGDSSEFYSQDSASSLIFPSRSILSGNWTFMIHSEKVSSLDTWKGQSIKQEVSLCGYQNISLDRNETSSMPPLGYENFHGVGLYKLHTDALSWEQAEETCGAEGAHLVVIDSEEEAEVVKALYAREKKNLLTTGIHIGIHDRDNEGHFLTVLGDPLDYPRWRPGQPDGGPDQNCGFVYSDAKMCDGDCKWKMGFICEMHVNNCR
ncbi:hemolymph lipopolysaccharide-binding protein isoform X2 [Anabrus simplex]